MHDIILPKVNKYNNYCLTIVYMFYYMPKL